VAPDERKSARTALALATIGGMLAVGVALTQIPAMRHGQGSRQLTGFAVVLVTLVAVGLLGHIATIRERQLRTAGSDGDRRTSITALAVGSLAAIVSISAFNAAFSYHASGARSERTQTEGVQAFGRVIQVVPIKHTAGLNDSWYSARVAVALPNNNAYYVRDTQKPIFGVGQRVRMLMDPTDRSYAEFPGLPQQERYTWLVALLICLVAASLSVGSFLSARGPRNGSRSRKLVAATAAA
jgi:hypothetical protein